MLKVWLNISAFIFKFNFRILISWSVAEQESARIVVNSSIFHDFNENKLYLTI